MKLKTIDVNGTAHAVVQDGKPVYVDDAGKEVAFDVVHTLGTITRLNGEAKGHRERAEKAEGSLKAFEAITDPAAAVKALETVANLSSGELKTAAQVEEMRATITKQAEQKVSDGLKNLNAKLVDTEGKLTSVTTAYSNEKITNAFAMSKFVAEKLSLPAPAIQKIFGEHFSVDETGKIIAKANGSPIVSKKSLTGDLADPEEAIEILVSDYAYRDNILKGTGQSGSGKKGNDGGGNGDKTMKRGDFDKLNPIEQSTKMREGFTLVD